MSARAYKPFSYTIKNIPIIIYPVIDENPITEIFDRKDHTSIQRHLDMLYNNFEKELTKGQYHIVFVWNLEGNRMIDVWICYTNNFSDSGPLLEVHTYQNMQVCKDAGIASGDSIITLGREEELRRKIKNLEEYIDRVKYSPEFPEGMQPIEEFYQ